MRTVGAGLDRREALRETHGVAHSACATKWLGQPAFSLAISLAAGGRHTHGTMLKSRVLTKVLRTLNLAWAPP